MLPRRINKENKDKKSTEGGAFFKDLLLPSGWNAGVTAWGLTGLNDAAHSMKKKRSQSRGGAKKAEKKVVKRSASKSRSASPAKKAKKAENWKETRIRV